MTRVAFVTHRALPALSDDDRLAAAALAERGLSVDPVVWDDDRVEWRRYDLVVLRSSWDYHTRPTLFRQWIDRRAEEGARLWNPPALLRWNMEKSYLLELRDRGIRVPATVAIERGGAQRLNDLMRDRGWRCAVVKPVISADGHRTWTATSPVMRADEERFAGDLRATPLLVQEYVESIEREGEWSFMFFGGLFSHAVRKRAAAGEFRVQSRFGGTSELVAAAPQIVSRARAVAMCAPTPWLYARVDGCIVHQELVVMELEMLEPSLFFSLDRAAAGRFADAILDVI